MTGKELQDYSAEHLYYELSMLYETAARFTDLAGPGADVTLRNAVIESFAVHARGLALCFPGSRPVFPEAARRRGKDAVTADQYVSNALEWRRARGKIPSVLKTPIDRTGKEIAHLTMRRHPAGSPDKYWSPTPILQAFSHPIRTFAARTTIGRLDVSVTTLLENLPNPSPRSHPDTMGIAGPPTTTDLTTERLSGITHVATTSVPPRLSIPLQKGGIP